jgi:hypothetical protein
MSEDHFCHACFAELPVGAKRKYCTPLCRQRAYRDRQRAARETERTRADPTVEQTDLVNVMAAVLAPECIENYLPTTRLHKRGVLEQALKTL